jgi:photosystem II stability/assembly factor-like uncharacterized protein
MHGGANLPAHNIAAIRTTGGGAEWSNLSLPESNAELAGISCASTTDCVAVGFTGASPYTGTPVAVSTTNGGTTWVNDPLPSKGLGLIAVSCPETTTCFAIEVSFSAGVVLKTTNGGKSWTNVSASTLLRGRKK